MPTTPLQSWLARLSFSFLLVAGVLLYRIWRYSAGQLPNETLWKIILLAILCITCILLGLIGLRIRHRPSDDL